MEIIYLFAEHLMVLGFWAVICLAAAGAYWLLSGWMGRREAHSLIQNPSNYTHVEGRMILNQTKVRAVIERLNKNHRRAYAFASSFLIAFTATFLGTILFVRFDPDNPYRLLGTLGLCFVWVFLMILALVLGRAYDRIALFFERVIKERALLVDQPPDEANTMDPSSSLTRREPQSINRRH